jgi:hypothetical protein
VYSSTEPLESPPDKELNLNVKADGARMSSSPTPLSAIRDDWEVFNVPEAVLTFAGRSGWKIGSGSGSGGVKVLLCAGWNVEVGGKVCQRRSFAAIVLVHRLHLE